MQGDGNDVGPPLAAQRTRSDDGKVYRTSKG